MPPPSTLAWRTPTLSVDWISREIVPRFHPGVTPEPPVTLTEGAVLSET
jgi:hypothetical protein